MHKLMAFAFLAALLWEPSQDKPNLDELIKRLGDDDPAIRADAEVALVKQGEWALGKLREALKSPDVEVSKRARTAIAAIEHNRIVAKAMGYGRRYTMSLESVPLSDLAKKLDLELQIPTAAKVLRVNLRTDKQELLRVLDAVARQIGLSCRMEGKVAVFSTDPFVEAPTSYVGPLRFRIANICTTSRNSFSKRSTEFEIAFSMDREPGVLEIVPAVRLLQATDGDGILLESNVRAALDNDSLAATAPELAIRASVARAVTRLKVLRCEAIFLIPAGSGSAVTLETLAAGASGGVGEIQVVVEGTDTKSIAISLRRRDGGRVTRDALTKHSAVLSSGGKALEVEFKEDFDGDTASDVRRAVQQLKGDPRLHLRLPLPAEARANGVDAVTLYVSDYVCHRVEFEFRDVELR